MLLNCLLDLSQLSIKITGGYFNKIHQWSIQILIVQHIKVNYGTSKHDQTQSHFPCLSKSVSKGATYMCERPLFLWEINLH